MAAHLLAGFPIHSRGSKPIGKFTTGLKKACLEVHREGYRPREHRFPTGKTLPVTRFVEFSPSPRRSTSALRASRRIHVACTVALALPRSRRIRRPPPARACSRSPSPLSPDPSPSTLLTLSSAVHSCQIRIHLSRWVAAPPSRLPPCPLCRHLYAPPPPASALPLLVAPVAASASPSPC